MSATDFRLRKICVSKPRNYRYRSLFRGSETKVFWRDCFLIVCARKHASLLSTRPASQKAQSYWKAPWAHFETPPNPPPRHEICTFSPESAPATKSDFKAPPPSLSPACALMEGFPHNCLWDEICTVSPAPAPAEVSTVWRSRRSGKHRLGNNRFCKHAHSKCTHVHLSRDWQWLG